MIEQARSMPSDSHLDFELQASPPHWYEVAKNLRDQADVLHRDQSSIVQFTNQRGEATFRFTTNRGVFLLAGFATENLLKAFAVYEFPEFVANGKLASALRTHRLTNIKVACDNIPYKNRYTSLLATFEKGIESWARYPCGLTSESSSFEREMTTKLWTSYTSMFRCYSRRLESLLTKGWVSPSGKLYHMVYEKID
jgi:hypothetical protein